MSTQKMYFLVKILAPLGILLAIYLLWQQFFTPEFKPCSINAWINCDAVISGPVAKTLGIPTPLYGLIGYTVIFISALYNIRKLLLGAASFGLLFCLYIAYVELVQLRVICPVCILCQLIMITVFTLSIMINRRHTYASTK